MAIYSKVIAMATLLMGKVFFFQENNEIIEGYFNYGFVQKGYTSICFPNGDYYEGMIEK